MMATINLYSKEQTDALLADKANSADVYTKAEADALITPKANSADVYTKTETNTLLNGKVDNSTLENYATKTYVDGKRTIITL